MPTNTNHCSGFITTPMLQSAVQSRGGSSTSGMAKSVVALGREGTAEEVAELILFLLGSGSSYISGQCISIDGGWNC